MKITTRPLTRKQISDFLPSLRSIIAFENLQGDVSNTGDVLSKAPLITTQADGNLGSERVLTGSANVSVTDGGAGADVTLDLEDTTVVAGTYGSQIRIMIQAIDAKGRITDVQEVKIDVSDVDGTLAAAHGGTGLSVYAIGDLIFASATNALSRLADVATGNALLSGGVGVAPSWGKVGLTTHVSGILPEANGGTGTSTAGFTGTVSPVTSATFVNGKCTAAS